MIVISFASKLRNQVDGAWLGAAMLLLAACGAEAEGSAEEIGSEAQELRCIDAPTDQDCPWRYWATLTPSIVTNDISHTLGPAECAFDEIGYLTVTVDSATSRYRTLQWWFGGKATTWGSFGNKAFSSRPACAGREDGNPDAPGTQPGIVLAGKGSGTDNYIYAAPGIMAPKAPSDTQQNPSTVVGQPWTAVSTTKYNVGGLPALATGGFGGTGVVLTFMGDDSRTIYAHFRSLPYLASGNSWGSRITGPQLPSGWTAIGAPAMAVLPVTMQIVVHARNGTQDRLFETHFFTNGSTAHFSNGIGSPVSSWTQLSIAATMDDGPALTYSDTFGSTVYFKTTGSGFSPHVIRQTTGFPLGSNPHHIVRPVQDPIFSSGPAATANVPFDRGTHIVVARSGTQLWFAETWNDEFLMP